MEWIIAIIGLTLFGGTMSAIGLYYRRKLDQEEEGSSMMDALANTRVEPGKSEIRRLILQNAKGEEISVPPGTRRVIVETGAESEQRD